MDIRESLEMEKKLLQMIIHEIEIVIRKYEKKVDTVTAKKLEKAAQYTSREEAQEAFGYGDINTEEYYSILDVLEGVENEELSLDETFLNNAEEKLIDYRRDLYYIKEQLAEEERGKK